MYKLQNNNLNEVCAILRLSDNASIPLCNDNTDYQAYLAWVAEGNVAIPADA